MKPELRAIINETVDELNRATASYGGGDIGGLSFFDARYAALEFGSKHCAGGSPKAVIAAAKEFLAFLEGREDQ